MITIKEKQINRFIETLKQFWLEHPDQRFGQLLYNYTRFGTPAVMGFIKNIFYYEDEDIVDDLNNGYKGAFVE